ncbi:acyl-CoA thioesterase [Tropicibacter oceani]|uniref:Hotdog domain-containing protein n=1 Tax=Tropicibacter oceani TaxID=3058420 RepID=A0ABY8QHJ3_9RHOB|nr:thioesterase family protein [Tropicibacter oceani]WGW04080.1 hotdog domain-containing protein [Tropicibacter oceani]
MSRPAPATRADYAAFRTLPTRWMDNDEYGHMNNAAYLSFIDTAVSLWQLDQGVQIRGPEALRFLVVETGVRYHSELGFPDIVHAGLRVGHLGRSSLRFEIGLFRNDDQTASAEGFFAQVLTGQNGRPMPIPDGPRAIFAGLTV